jgi:hypothetical protein
MIDISTLRPGDVLLYAPSGFFGWLIALKTWEKVSHVEVYAGNRCSWACRDGKGVGFYPLRMKGLKVVRRAAQFDHEKATAYFKTVDGQAYDWIGLAVFASLKQHGDKFKQWCSEFADNIHFDAGNDLFGSYPSDHIAPADFLKTPLLSTVWEKA